MSLRVLLVDDNRIDQKLYQRLAAGRSVAFELEAILSDEEALMLLKSFQIDVVIVDVNMPGMSGFEILQKAIEQGLIRKMFRSS